MKKPRRNDVAAPNGIDCIKSMQAEIDECVGLLRPHYPKASDRQLRNRADSLRSRRYSDGHWPDFAAMAREEAAAQAAREETRARWEAVQAQGEKDPLPDVSAADAATVVSPHDEVDVRSTDEDPQHQTREDAVSNEARLTHRYCSYCEQVALTRVSDGNGSWNYFCVEHWKQLRAEEPRTGEAPQWFVTGSDADGWYVTDQDPTG